MTSSTIGVMRERYKVRRGEMVREGGMEGRDIEGGIQGKRDMIGGMDKGA